MAETTQQTWNELEVAQRARLLKAAYPHRSVELIAHEASLRWGKLLPSTQDDLRKLDWSEIA